MSTGAFLESSKSEKINQFLMLIKDPDVEHFFRTYIENVLATSELNIPKRLTCTERVLGLTDYPNFDGEERVLSLQEQFSQMSKKIKDLEESIQNKPIMKSDTMLTTKTENRAKLLVEYLKHRVKGKSENKALSSQEIVHFLKYEIDEKYRVISKNIRQTKKEVLEKAVELFHDIVFLSKKTFGRRNVRIVFRS
jgi:hypothetical protein